MPRYYKFNFLTQCFFVSKAPFFHALSLNNIKFLTISGGHFKFSSVYAEHGLIFRSLVGQNPSLQFFTHGKRVKKTVLLSNTVSKSKIWLVLDKLLNIVLPSLNDLKTLKFKRVRRTYAYD